MKTNQKGFGHLAIIAVILVLCGLGFAGWYVYHKNQSDDKKVSTTVATKTTPSTSKTTTSTFDSAITGKIENFTTASSSLQTALVNSFYPDAKKTCDEENASVDSSAQISWVMSVQQMVRDDFAKVAKVDGTWKNVGSLSMAPACSLVDQYKISKEITPTCYIDNTSESRSVTYN
jgi:predicted negative regulator of RcsB-dependent stress response